MVVTPVWAAHTDEQKEKENIQYKKDDEKVIFIPVKGDRDS